MRWDGSFPPEKRLGDDHHMCNKEGGRRRQRVRQQVKGFQEVRAEYVYEGLIVGYRETAWTWTLARFHLGES